ncbi:MAG: hypothetical protein HYV07_08140 [Deltaproteobacteria bacterium]|nr:hypothetical protein [Deltaproteobacteria bacterium]
MASCSPNLSFVPLPSLEGAASALLALAASDRPLVVQLIDLDQTLDHLQSIELEDWESSEGFRIDVARFSCPVSALGLGDVTSCGKGCFTPASVSKGQGLPSWMRGSRFEPGSGWTEVADGLFDGMDFHFEVDGRRSCAEFRVQRLALGTVEHGPFFMSPSPDGGVLFGMADGTFQELVHHEILPYTRLSSGAPNRGAFLRDRTLFLVGANGSAATLDPDRGLSSLDSLRHSPPVRIAWLDGAPKGQTFELFVLTSEGVVQVLDGLNWSYLRGSPPGAELLDRGFAGIARVGTDQAIAIVSGPEVDERALLYLNGETAEEIQLPGESDGGGLDVPSAVAFSPRMGALVGTRYGSLLRHRPDHTFEVLSNLPEVRRIRSVLISGEEVFFGGTDGVLSEYRPWFGVCDSVHIAGEGVVEGLARDGRLVLLLRPDGENVVRVEVLERINARPECFALPEHQAPAWE